jgi:hypothetical protein
MKAWRSFLEKSQREMGETKRKVSDLYTDLREIEVHKAIIAKSAEAIEKSRLSKAQVHLQSTRAAMLAYPGKLEEIIFKDFPTKGAIKTTTDSDGNFVISYPRKKSFVLFATAQWRSKGAKPLAYYWCINAPKDGISPLILSNSKLIDADPDDFLLPFKNLSIVTTD